MDTRLNDGITIQRLRGSLAVLLDGTLAGYVVAHKIATGTIKFEVLDFNTDKTGRSYYGLATAVNRCAYLSTLN